MDNRTKFIAKYGNAKMIDDELDRQLADPERKDMSTGKGLFSPKFVKMAFHHSAPNLSARFVNHVYSNSHDESLQMAAASHPLLSDENLVHAGSKHSYSLVQTAAIMHKNVTEDLLKHLTVHGGSEYVRGLAASRLRMTPEKRAADSASWHGDK